MNKKTILALILVITGVTLDQVSTNIGIKKGYHETNPLALLTIKNNTSVLMNTSIALLIILFTIYMQRIPYPYYNSLIMFHYTYGIFHLLAGLNNFKLIYF